MATFPSNIVSIANPSATQPMNASPYRHAEDQHTVLNEEMIAVQTALLSSSTVTTTTTAVAFGVYHADASSAAFAVTFPASPHAGTPVQVTKIDSTANAVTVTCPAGTTFADGSTTLALTSQNVGATWVFDGSSKWIVQGLQPGAYVPVAGAATEVTTPLTLDSLKAKSSQTTAPLGPELTGSSWTFTGTATASGGGGQFASGGGTMAQTLAGIVSGTWYQVTWTQTGASSGNLNVQIGTASRDGGSTPYWWPNGNTARIVANASGSLTLTFTGDGSYNGAVTGVSVKAITGPSTPAAVLVDATGVVRGELRADALNNTAAGQGALQSNTTGSFNTAAGTNALHSNTTGYYNTAAGTNALQSNTTGNYNTAAGTNALYSNTTGNYNTAAGQNALHSNTTGYYNTAAGQAALYSNTTGNYNTAAGTNALQSNTTGSFNTAAGTNALQSNTTGNYNTAAGTNAGYAPLGNAAFATTTATGQTILGYQSGQASATQANYISTLGYQTTVTAAGGVAIGADHTGAGAVSVLQDEIALGTANHQVRICNNTTGAGSAALGANSPAATPAAPYTWFKMLSSDGSTVYVPAWK